MIRLGFIGAGGYGRWHIDGFLALQAQGLVKVAAFADPSAAVLDALREVGELREARGFSDYRDLLAEAEIDAVVISAPIPLHHEMTLAALERGLFIFLEKPPVPLLSQLDELIAADRDVRVMVAFQNIYSDLIGDLKRELVAGRIGRLRSISAFGLWPRPDSYYRRSGWAGQIAWRGHPVLDGPCTNGMAHFINLSLYLAGDKTGSYAMPAYLAGETYRARPDIPSYDTGCLNGQLEGGAKCFMGFTHATSALSPVEIRLVGTEGTLQLVQDCRVLRSEDGRLAQGNDGSENLRRAFVEFVRGDASQNRTPLSAMRPYVLATNLMFQSSGGIHPVPGEFVRRIETESDGALFDIGDVLPAFRQCAGELVPLHESGTPWARETPTLAASEFSEVELMSSLHQDPEADCFRPAHLSDGG